MKNQNALPILSGSVLIVPGLVFFIFVLLAYAFNVATVRGPFDDFVTAYLLELNPLSVVLNGLIILGPVAALVINAIPFVRQNVKIRTDGALVVITITRESLPLLALIGIGGLLAVVFMAYGLTENWQCIIGAKSSC